MRNALLTEVEVSTGPTCRISRECDVLLLTRECDSWWMASEGCYFSPVARNITLAVRFSKGYDVLLKARDTTLARRLSEGWDVPLIARNTTLAGGSCLDAVTKLWKLGKCSIWVKVD